MNFITTTTANGTNELGGLKRTGAWAWLRMSGAVGLLLGVAAGLTGCTTTNVVQSSGTTATGLRVSALTVKTANEVAPEDRAWLGENDVEQVMMKELWKSIRNHKRKADQGAVLEVTITSARLRSTSAVVWVGPLAGMDHMAAQVRVIEHGRVVKTFFAQARRASGLVNGPGAGQRTESLCEELADSLVRQL